jgi:hypothetical protein
MKTRTFRHENVLPDGTFSDKAGAVGTKGGIKMSASRGGCGIRTCNCSPGHWISITQPRTEEGIVVGTVINFTDKKEMDKYLNENQLKRI